MAMCPLLLAAHFRGPGISRASFVYWDMVLSRQQDTHPER